MITKKINNCIEQFPDQYFYGEPVGVYFIELDDKIILFDIPTYSAEVENYLISKNKPVSAVLSHGSCGIADGTLWQQKIGLKVYLHKADATHQWLRMKPDYLFTEPPFLGPTIEIIHTPGHSPGSICLIEKTTKTLFSGDTFGGTDQGQIRDFREEDKHSDDIPKRLASCQKLLNYDFETILPFHYEQLIGNGKKALSQYLQEIE